jgi:hypothetical protein
MNKQVIKFVSGSPIRKLENEKPVPIVKTLPKWYKDADKYISDDNDKYSTFKNCVPFFDAMTAGYTHVTPCDIEFFIENNVVKHRVLDPNFEFFIEARNAMEQFHNPAGYYAEHFHWFPEWYPVLPDGYSLLCTMPFNRYELPFLTTSGIIDSDKAKMAGRIPFFLKEGFTGVIKAGTPIAQLIPIKREEWKAEYQYPSHGRSMFEILKNIKKYREPKRNAYRDNDWVKKIYE